MQCFITPLGIFLVNTLKNIFPLIMGIMIITTSYSLGFSISKLFKFEIKSDYSNFFYLLLGEQLLIIIMLLAGTFRLLSINFFLPFIVIANLLIIKKIKYIMTSFAYSINSFSNSSYSNKFLLILLFCLSFILTANSFSPFTWYDSLVYHIAVPYRYLSDNSISYIAGNVYSNFPLNGEMLNLSALLIGNEITAKFLIVIHIILLQIICAKFVYKETKHSELSLITSIIIGSNMIIFKQIIQGNIDLYLTFAVTTFLIFMKDLKFKNPESFIISGILCGIMCGFKYLSGPFFLIPAFLTISYKSYKNKIPLKYLIYFITSCIFTFSPWLIKNLCFTGNPFYPFLFKIFNNSRDWNIFLNEIFMLAHQPAAIDILQKIKTTISDLDGFIIILSLFTFTSKKNRLPVIIILLSVFIWALISKGHSRFILPVYPLLLSISFIQTKEFSLKSIRQLTYFLLIFLMLIRTCSLFLINIDIFSYLFAVKSPVERSLSLSDPYYEAINFINTRLQNNSKILFLSESRTYNCNKKLSSATLFNRNIIENFLAKGDQYNTLNELKNAGFTHIFYNHLEFQRLNKDYGKFFPEYAGFSFEKESVEYHNFINLLNLISEKNILPEKFNKKIILYKITSIIPPPHLT